MDEKQTDCYLIWNDNITTPELVSISHELGPSHTLHSLLWYRYLITLYYTTQINCRLVTTLCQLRLTASVVCVCGLPITASAAGMWRSIDGSGVPGRLACAVLIPSICSSDMLYHVVRNMSEPCVWVNPGEYRWIAEVGNLKNLKISH